MNKSFDVKTVLALATGMGCGATMGDIHEAMEWVMGHPVWTHELAVQALWDKSAKIVRETHPQLIPAIEQLGTFRGKSDHTEEVNHLVSVLTLQFGPLELPKGSEVRAKSPLETLEEIAPGKPVVVGKV